jgi:hypothetical protein
MVILALSIVIMFSVKYSLYSLKREIVIIDKEIQRNVEEKQILEAEWSYLTTPERLRNLLANNQEKYIVIKVAQIKKLETLAPYYLAKSKKVGNNNVALISSRNELYY